MATQTIRDDLTPDDVTAKTFTAVGRKPEGYDMGEVDLFLDEVVATLRRLENEREQTAREVARTSGGLTRADAVNGVGGVDGHAAEDGVHEPPAPAVVPQREPAAEPMSASAATSAAVRVLQMAQDEAEQIRAQATSDADQAVADARQEADALQEQTRIRRAEMLSELEAERARLGDDVAGLRAFEREYRARLRTYFQDQIGRLDAERVPQASAVDGDSKA